MPRLLGRGTTNHENRLVEWRTYFRIKRSVGAAIRTDPGNTVAGHPPGIVLHTMPANLKSAWANPAKLFPVPAAVTFKGSPGFFIFSYFIESSVEKNNPHAFYRERIVKVSPGRTGLFLFRLFHWSRSPEETLYLAAILCSVSPFFTLC